MELQSRFRTPALSEVKTRLKLAEIQEIAPQVVGLRTEWRYYVAVSEPLNPEEEQELNWFLAETFEPRQFGPQSFLRKDGLVAEVGPRRGLVTPWSSNIRTIFVARGLSKIQRVERVRRYHLIIKPGASLSREFYQEVRQLLYDRMTEEPYEMELQTFDPGITPEPVRTIPLLEEGIDALRRFTSGYGLAFSSAMEEYIYRYFIEELQRNPTDVEIFMFGQLNSEHCRHHKFNGIWTIDGVLQPKTLMDMIRETVTTSPGNVEVAFADNAAILRPHPVSALIPSRPQKASVFTVVLVCRGIVYKIETHNHPTTVSPYEGAATGVAVRRDIFGAGRGSVPVGHLACYYIGNLMIPGYDLPWEQEYVVHPSQFATPLEIIIRASDGASDNCNCFGCPVLMGSTRSFEGIVDGEHYGYRKTAMVAGCFGYVDQRHIQKEKPEAGMLVIQIGGESFPVGVGGGSGSSHDAGGQAIELDFNSVQRDDAYVERGNFEVFRACSELGDDNPIVTETDLGAGGDCVAVPELTFPAGARVELRKVPCGDKTMIVLVFWCNESQERMVILIWPEKLPLFQQICQRNRCRMSVIGEVTGDGQFILTDSQASADAPREQRTPIEVGMNWLLADLPQMKIECQTVERQLKPAQVPKLSVKDHLNRVLRLLDVCSKRFLTVKADRSVGNRSARQQEVGPLQLPLADCAVTADGPFDLTGMATAIGEQPIKGLIDHRAGARMSFGEVLTNIVWALVEDIRSLNFSCTWQWPCGHSGEDARLYQTVQAAAAFCKELRSRIPVGKDSLSMALKALEPDGTSHSIKAPGTVQMAAFGPCLDITKTVTPDLKEPGRSKLMLIDLAPGKQRLGASALLRVYKQIGDQAPDIDNPDLLIGAFQAIQELIRRGLILSGHDRSDGGLITCLLEMAFSGNCGLDLDFWDKRLGSSDPVELLFNEELGLVIEYQPQNYEKIHGVLRRHGLTGCCYVIGQSIKGETIKVRHNGATVLQESMPELRAIWQETSFRLDERQATPEIVAEERRNTYRRLGPQYVLPFKPRPTTKSLMKRRSKSKVAILREAGINGDRDMAESFQLAGFEVWDIHATDLISGKITLDEFKGVANPGGFSFKDTLDAGKGAAGVIKFNPRAADQFAAFRDRNDTFFFGVCNGCQFMALLGIMPWAGIPTEKQPRFIRNLSERFESRWVTVRILPSDSIFLQGMEDSVLGIAVAHREGRFHCPDQTILEQIIDQGLAPIRYVNDRGEIAEDYPFNPNGSPMGIAGLSALGGRFLAMMPHAERLPLNWLWPWQPREWKNLKASPWLKLFQNAREWCDGN